MCSTSSLVTAIDPQSSQFSHQQVGPLSGPRFGSEREALDCLDVRGLCALGALHDLELHALTLGQRLVPVHRDCGEVDEDVLPTLTLDEPVALLVREPLHGALSQLSSFNNMKRRPR